MANGGTVDYAQVRSARDDRLLWQASGSWFGPLPFPLSQYGYPGCMLFTSIDVFVATTLGASGNAAGYGFVVIPVPLSTTGVPVHGQWLALGTGSSAPGRVSDALRWRH